MPFEGRNLILRAAGGFRLGETVKALQRRVAGETGIGFASLQKFWKGQYGSKRTVSTLKQAANNADNLASNLEKLAFEAELAGRPQRDIDALRAAAHQIRDTDVRARPAYFQRSKE